MDVRQTLLDTELALRDFIAMIMKQQIGEDWLVSSGLTEERIKELHEVKERYEQLQNSISEENQLLNYTDFLDLKTIIQRHWEGDFELAFGDLDTLKTYMRILERYHDPDRSNRALLTHQKHLILGITGVLRNRMVLYRSWKEHGKKGFPKIESIRDNLGNLWVVGKPKKIRTGVSLRVGDVLEFVITAKDPEDMDLEYRVHPYKWQSGNVIMFEIEKQHIGLSGNVHITIRSPRKHHAYPMGYDDRVSFEYEILPKD
tara:strand:- start:670 stop:1443 length:774 start_codon:yes stop_codon:yes gene_type:complete